MALALAPAFGPLGGLGGLDGGATVGWAASSPPLGNESSSTLHRSSHQGTA